MLPKWLSQVPFKSEDLPLITESKTDISKPSPSAQIYHQQSLIGSNLLFLSQTKLSSKSKQEIITTEEAERNRYLLIQIKLHSKQLWLSEPIICSWDDDRKIWTTEHIKEPEFNEEKQLITFRTQRFGVFSLAVEKYCCMPFRYWRMRPEKE